MHRVVSSGGELLRELEVMQEGERDKRRKADNDEESLRLAVQLAKVGCRQFFVMTVIAGRRLCVVVLVSCGA